MELSRPADAEAFLGLAGPFLSEREAEHNLILGLAGRLRADPLLYGEPPYYAVVSDSGRVVAAALRTPPHNLALSETGDPAAVEAITDDVLAVFVRLPGVTGPKAATERFARLWEERAGQRGRVAIAQRIFQADFVQRPSGVPGGHRPYRTADRERILRWAAAFAEEALPPGGPRFDPQDWLARRLSERDDAGIVIWEDDTSVSFAAFGAPTPTGIRVGPVYTPPEHRGRGYATALVADLTRSLLDEGYRYCFLFTDLANPTSNAIYERIGYRPVSDVDQWAFEDRPPA